ncbi:hypothetical protein MKX03_025918 [Papaver bracteatum]|nr:hypothetical protein MKX03_025918 [Papaver bracteatum]
MCGKKKLKDCRPEDISLSLLRMFSYNIGQIAYLTACKYGVKRIYFGGFFIRGNAFTMNTISHAVRYWSNGAAEAMFLHHEGFLGALGAFLSSEKHGVDDFFHQLVEQSPVGACYMGGANHSPQLACFCDKVQTTGAAV